MNGLPGSGAGKCARVIVIAILENRRAFRGV
jgi:hypothetical protein